MRDYAADAVAGIIDDMQDENAEDIATEIQSALDPLLEGAMDDSQLQELCVAVARAFKGLGQSSAAENSAGEVEKHLIKCDGIILAYAGKSLLRASSLRLLRGHRYGLVGQNGAGKSTLLKRLDAGDIANFPAGVKVAFVRQDSVLDDGCQSALQYIMAASRDAKSEDEARRILTEVGFSEQLQAAAVVELSGGWRMKLTLASAIISRADLLLLDEPTNHLDSASVKWLGEYLTHLKSTVVIVSHDYDFLNEVITDVVHLTDQTLNYYQEGWHAFAAANPKIVEALPRKKNASYFAQVTGENEAQIVFPNPGALEGIKSKVKTIASLSNVSFKYTGGDKAILKDVTCRLSLCSRVGIVGSNGAGKTTLLRLLVGDLKLRNTEEDLLAYQGVKASRCCCCCSSSHMIACPRTCSHEPIRNACDDRHRLRVRALTRACMRCLLAQG